MGLRWVVSAAGFWVLSAGANPHSEIGGYQPVSNVVEHSQMVQDIKDLTTLLNGKKFEEAKLIYTDGSHSCKTTSTRRTLQGFVSAKTAADKLTGEAFFDSFTDGGGPSAALGAIPGSGRLNFPKTFWDDFVLEALAGTLRFKDRSETARKVAAAKGVLGVLTMYAAHELESAISKANSGSTADDTGAPHAWDEGWAFYYGSLSKGASSAWEFTKKRDLDYAYLQNVRVAGTVEGTADIVKHFREGLNASRTGTLHVSQMIASRDNIYRIWALSSIRAALKYAYKAQSAGYREDYHMEAYAYFLAAAGWVEQASPGTGAAVLSLLDFQKSSSELDTDLYCSVKAALIPAYQPLGLDCAMVGTFKDLPSSKTCSNLPSCPTMPALPEGLSSYAPSTTTAKGSNVDCRAPAPTPSPTSESSGAGKLRSWSAFATCVALVTLGIAA